MTALLVTLVMASSVDAGPTRTLQRDHHPSTPVVTLAAGGQKFRHRGCNSHRCDRRVDRKLHRRTVSRWWRVVRPHNGHLEAIAWCESRRRWRINTGNGFYGGLQFTLRSWQAVGGRGYPHHATPLEQKYRAVRLSWVQGWGAWPVCG